MPQPGVQTEPKNRSDLHPRKIISQTSDSKYKLGEFPLVIPNAHHQPPKRDRFLSHSYRVATALSVKNKWEVIFSLTICKGKGSCNTDSDNNSDNSNNTYRDHLRH
jgi:hypothetical protein